MPSLAESVMGAAQQGVERQSHTVGDAMSAYHIAATAEHARQSLEMEKANQEINKANWLATALDKANRMTGATRNAMIDSIGLQYQKLNPSGDPKVWDVLKKQTPQEQSQLAWNVNNMVKNGGAGSKEEASQLLDGLGSLDLYTAMLEKGAQYQATIEAGKARAEAIQGPKREMLAWNKHKTAIEEIAGNKVAGKLLGQKQAIENSLMAYKNSGGMPQELAQLQTSLRINAGTGGTGVSERAEGYATDLGISRDKVLQIMSGKIQDTELSSPQIVKAIMHIAQGEIRMKQQQGIMELKKQHKTFEPIYATDPYAAVHRGSFETAVKQSYAQFGADENGNLDYAGANGPGISPDKIAGEPAVGTISKGHRYKGGGAHIQENWEPITAGATPAVAPAVTPVPPTPGQESAGGN